jgi:hypothetical protein
MELNTCVQCGNKYDKAKKIEGGCSFHSAPTLGRYFSGYKFSSQLLLRFLNILHLNWLCINFSRFPSCCGSTVPCKQSTHRSTHHCDYPYAKFFEMATAINSSLDTIKLWGVCEDKDLLNIQGKQFSMSCCIVLS